MPIILQGFAGEIPRVEPRYLPQTAAEATSNVGLARGSLAPTRNPHTWETLAGARGAVYLFNGAWMSWVDPTTRVVPGPVKTDRLYITSDNAKPKLWVSGTTHDLAVPAPASAPALTRTGTLDPELTEKILYAYTFVTSLGEESPPSPLSSPISWSPGCTITVGSMATAPVGSRITKKRIYRSQTSESGVTDLYFVAEVNATDVAYVHDLESAPLQEALPSADYDPPPDSMTGLIALPNGIMAAFTGKEVLFSEPWQPHAWPTKYRLAVTERIVALAAFGSSVAVLTQGTPYVVQGLHPDSMAMERMESGLPCVSARSVVDMGFDAIYASTEGLVRITAQGAQVISKPLWTAEQWNDINPSSIIASAHNGRYVMAHTPVADPGPTTLVIDISGETPFITTFSDTPISFHLHQPTGRLFYIGADQVSVQQFDPPNRILRDYAWKSRPFFSPVFTDPETGDVLGGVVTFRNDATGETFQQVFDDPGKMVDNALFALSPQVAFEAQQTHQKAAAEAAAKARETADQRAWDMGLEIERTARGIHARMMSEWGKERDAVALTGGEAPPMPTMVDARAEARGEIASYSAGTPYLAYID